MRKTTICLGSVAALILGSVIAWPSVEFFLMTGNVFPVRKIDKLQNPVAVLGWSSGGLRLADGRTVQLPGLRSLPSDSEALAEATKRGVEIRANGRVWGLVSVHHWCGNDPIRRHFARVDIGQLLEFLVRDVPPELGEPLDLRLTDGYFGVQGWNMSQWYAFEEWSGRDPGRIYN